MLLVLVDGPSPQAKHEVSTWMILVISFGTLGFIDDRWGDKQVKGLRGHLRAAFVDHRITSGFVKAVGGVSLGLLIGFRLSGANLAQSAGYGLIIALAANGMNLFDLRPGRACAVFLFCSSLLLSIALCLPSPPTGELLLVFVVLPAAPAWILDSRARVMLGDTGSNVLGAALGLAIVESRSIVLQISMLALLVLLHIVAERRSITQIIAANRFLNGLDKLTGVR
jgi:UDP-N-acetylmuramyl pentapeptide phosphotransferase/UDP-N-acetylglucosamine-1-phosphate transferase